MEFDERFTDPRTGERVTRCKVPEKLNGDIQKHVTENTQHAQKFVNMARQELMFSKEKIKAHDDAVLAEQNLNKEILRVREKMGLDSSWMFNLALGIMEKREPPVEEGTLPQGVPPTQ